MFGFNIFVENGKLHVNSRDRECPQVYVKSTSKTRLRLSGKTSVPAIEHLRYEGVRPGYHTLATCKTWVRAGRNYDAQLVIQVHSKPGVLEYEILCGDEWVLKNELKFLKVEGYRIKPCEP